MPLNGIWHLNSSSNPKSTRRTENPIECGHIVVDAEPKPQHIRLALVRLQLRLCASCVCMCACVCVWLWFCARALKNRLWKVIVAHTQCNNHDDELNSSLGEKKREIARKRADRKAKASSAWHSVIISSLPSSPPASARRWQNPSSAFSIPLFLCCL